MIILIIAIKEYKYITYFLDRRRFGDRRSFVVAPRNTGKQAILK